jgi:hypothetical protein
MPGQAPVPGFDVLAVQFVALLLLDAVGDAFAEAVELVTPKGDADPSIAPFCTQEPSAERQ